MHTHKARHRMSFDLIWECENERVIVKRWLPRVEVERNDGGLWSSVSRLSKFITVAWSPTAAHPTTTAAANRHQSVGSSPRESVKMCCFE